MQEYSLLEEIKKTKKQYAEFLTPEKLRLFLAKEVGKCETIFDPCVGSGALFSNIDAIKKIGNDLNIKSVEYANKNGIETTNYDYIIMDDSNINYDVVVSNYPFSLTPTEEQQEYLKQNYKQFLNKQGQFTGKLDFIFILKSFLKETCKQGFYYCFPGISYRNQELKYRQFLIDNNYIDKFYLMKNCGFNDTNIDIFYLKLKKDRTENDLIKVGIIDNCEIILEKEISKQEIINNEYCLSPSSYIEEEKEKEKINIDELNDEIYKIFLTNIKRELEQIFFIKNIGGYKNLTIENIKSDINNIINEILKNNEIN